MQKFQNVSILLVDAHPNMRILWRTILIGFGVRKVFETGDALSALDYLANDTIDLVIAENQLPDLSGADFTRMVRNSEVLPFQIPIIACTADTRRTMLLELVNSGVDEILSKPVSAAQAWQKIAAVVNNRRQFVRTSIYLGPCRRRKISPYKGDDRRMTTIAAAAEM